MKYEYRSRFQEDKAKSKKLARKESLTILAGAFIVFTVMIGIHLIVMSL